MNAIFGYYLFAKLRPAVFWRLSNVLKLPLGIILLGQSLRGRFATGGSLEAHTLVNGL